MRLPVHVTAKLNALFEIFPNTTKTEIVGDLDLLATAIDEVDRSRPTVRGQPIDDLTEHGLIVESHGPRAEVQRLAISCFKELERELGTKNSSARYAAPPYERE